MRGSVILKRVSRGVAVTLVFFGAAECLVRLTYFVRNSMVTYVPLPYVIGHDYEPVPPWLQDLLILAPDKTLIWRNRPNAHRRYVDIFRPVHSDQERLSLFRRFVPALQNSLKDNPVWEIRLNSEGYRGGERTEKMRASAFRIICLGDSWTFGMNVGDELTYPQRLRALLKQEFPQMDLEVLNRGVLGYSSYQGVELLKSRITDWQPDVVVIAFGMNDSKVAGYRDKDVASHERNLSLAKKISRQIEKSETYKLLRYLALILRHKAKPIGYYLKAQADAAAKWPEGSDFENLEPWTRVSPKDYEKNVLEMIHLAKSRKASVILLYNELWEDSPYRAVLAKISKEEGVPLVDSSVLIADARRKIEAELERKLSLEPGTRQALSGGKAEVIFRVYLGKTPVPKAIHIVGTHPKLGDLVPNRVAMYDDGTHGDQKPGDGVWSYSAVFPTGMRLFYVYTNSGEEGKWEGLDVPHIREFKVEARPNQGRVYSPIESFGRIYMQADSWHPDASGYELIAKRVVEALKDSEKVKECVRQASDERR